MITLQTPDGIETMWSDRDVIEAIDKYIGMEFANYIKERLDEADATIVYQQARAETDADSLQSDVEKLESELRDAADIIEEMLEDEKITKAKMISKLNVLEQDIRRQL